MSFKKKKLKNESILLVNIIGLLSVILVSFLGYLLLKNIDILNFNIPKQDKVIKNIKIENNQNNISLKNISTKEQIIPKKTKRNKINILILGRGGGNHDAPDLTDTIILANIDIDNKYINLLSIPRDLYVKYDKKTSGKINGLYIKETLKTKSKNKGITALENKITQITGEKINYFVNVDFKGFISIIDTIGGINITIPKYFQDNRYPDGKDGYKTLIFKKGTWNFNGENALKYARSRHSTSDFDRSMRQQQVLKSLKNKITGTYFLKSPSKIKELYNVFKKYLDTDLNLTTILKLAYLLNGDGFTITNSNLNDSCFYGSNSCKKGGLLYTPDRSIFGGMSVLLLEGTNISDLENYKKSIKFSDIIFNHPNFKKENYKLNIFNSTKKNNLAGILSNDIKKFGFNISDRNSIGNTKKIYPKSIIYYNNIEEDSDTLQILKTFFNGKIEKINYPKYSNNNANIEIIIGEDYLTKKEIFKF